ncbi:TPA: TraK family protein [Legionella pneumophila]|nr:TraK family protein [Legionella pneumophila subsp. fraseri]HAT1773477.1 TraK family protein [Legionella pneumophila]MDX1847671.1 TraK family protein [Legionella pneumophila subsp. fraseri]HAT2128228.1 TraK family protein [Legionella pneumophila]HAT2137379.1 TraK family protein [Legionella pneumophila]
MKKLLTEAITTSNQNQPRTSSRKSKVEFLSLREDISDALEKGWSMTAIWETLRDEGSFTATYNTFRLYVLEYLNGQKPGYSQQATIEQRTKALAESNTKMKKSATIPSFTFNPIPNPEDLV